MAGESWLYDFANVGVDDPYDEKPDAHLYDLINVGVDDPYDEKPDAHLYDFANVTLVGAQLGAWLYDFALVDTTTPAPHLWYVVPTFGEVGWQFAVVGYGLGDTQGEYAGVLKLGALTCSILSWQGVAGQAPPQTIDPAADIADPVHQRLVAIVPNGAVSGVLTVETDGP